MLNSQCICRTTRLIRHLPLIGKTSLAPNITLWLKFTKMLEVIVSIEIGPGTVGTGDPQTEEDGHYVQDALVQGYRFGMIASGDHFGITIAAVYARGLTRDAVFDALKKRRCYGTTGQKFTFILLLIIKLWVQR